MMNLLKNDEMGQTYSTRGEEGRNAAELLIGKLH
jgi:hypothetical protein